MNIIKIKNKKNILLNLIMGGLILTSSSIVLLESKASKSNQPTSEITNNLDNKNNKFVNDDNTFPDWLNDNGKILAGFLNNKFTIPLSNIIKSTLATIEHSFQRDFMVAFPSVIQGKIVDIIGGIFPKIAAEISKEQGVLVNKLTTILTSFKEGSGSKISLQEVFDILVKKGTNGLIDYINDNFLNPAKNNLIHKLTGYTSKLKSSLKPQLIQIVNSSLPGNIPFLNKGEIINGIQMHSDVQFTIINRAIDVQIAKLTTILNNFKIPHVKKNETVDLKKLQNLAVVKRDSSDLKRKLVFEVINKDFMPAVDSLLVSIIEDVVRIFTEQDNSIQTIMTQIGQIAVNGLSAGWHIPFTSLNTNNLKNAFVNFGNNFHNNIVPKVQIIATHDFYTYLQNFKLV